MLKVNCTATTTTVTESETLVSGRVGLQIEFSFSAEWEGLNKTACFRGENDYEVILNENTIEVPWEALSASGYPLYVGAIGKTADGTIVIPTTWCKVGRIQQGVGEENGATPQPPTPDIVSQIQQTAANARATSLEAIDVAVKAKSDAEAAKNAAVNAQDSANNAAVIAQTAANSAALSANAAEGYASDSSEFASRSYEYSQEAKRHADESVSLTPRVEALETGKADKSTTYTKQEVDTKVAQATPTDYAQVKEQLNENTDDIAELSREMAGAAEVVGQHSAEIVSLRSEKISKPVDAPEVGKVLKIKSVNEDGTFTCEWADDEKGISLDDIPTASATDRGLIKISTSANSTSGGGIFLKDGRPYINTKNAYGVFYSDGYGSLRLVDASIDQINRRAANDNVFAAIVPHNLDFAVKASLTDDISLVTWSDTEKQAARERIGADGGKWELVAYTKAEEELASCTINVPSNYEIYECKVIVKTHTRLPNNYNALRINYNDNTAFVRSYFGSNYNDFIGILNLKDAFPFLIITGTYDANMSGWSYNGFSTNLGSYGATSPVRSSISSVWLTANSNSTFPIGMEVFIYGRV